MRSSLLFRVLPLLAVATGASAETIETAAKQAIIVDFNTGSTLLEKNADELMTPSSMSKLMTVYLVFDALKQGRIKFSDTMPVTETAWKKHYKTDESLMFLPINSNPTVEELLKGVIIQSGNDACSVLAEGLAGSEEAFAEQETKRAREIGLQHSSFRNASGVPAPDHKMTARDLSILATHLINDFPDFYPIFSEKTFTYNGIKQDNRNPLIWGEIPGADGLKTGHTEEAGYGEVGSVQRNGRRIILVLNGLGSIKQRAEESQKLAEWAFREFDDYHVYTAGQVLGDVKVTDGKTLTVQMQTQNAVDLTLQRIAHNDMKTSVTHLDAVAAPVKKGQEIGKATISVPGRPDQFVTLVAANDVEALGFMGKLRRKLSGLIGG